LSPHYYTCSLLIRLNTESGHFR